MIRWCSFCQRYLGEATPFDHYDITHGMCQGCAAAFSGGHDFSRAGRLAAFYDKLRVAGRDSKIPPASAVLDEGIALGLRPIDLLMGLVQPALYQVGEGWAAGQVTVAGEHAFTAMVSALLTLVMYKYPEALAHRQSQRPRVLLVAAEGNYHTLGVQLVELILILEGIPTFTVHPGIGAAEVVQLWRTTRAPLVGFSIAQPEQLKGVQDAVAAIAADAAPPRFVLGGFPIRSGLQVRRDLPIETLHDPLALLATLA